MYGCMNIEQLHQLLNGPFKNHTWEWIVGLLKDIYSQEKGLDLIDKLFSIIPLFSDIHQVEDKHSRMKQWTGAKYKAMVMVWLPALTPLFTGHLDHFMFIKSGTGFTLFASYHSHTKTTLKYLQDALSVISTNIHLFLPYCKTHYMRIFTKIDSLHYYAACIREMGYHDDRSTKIS